jgi:hypothetical protein
MVAMLPDTKHELADEHDVLVADMDGVTFGPAAVVAVPPPPEGADVVELELHAAAPTASATTITTSA